MSQFSHVDADARPAMVDVSGKTASVRRAVAETRVRLPSAVAAELRRAGYDTAKGPVLHTAIVAGTMAAKRTHDLIPFCHPLGIEKCSIDITEQGDDLVIRCTVGVTHKTGVEMEALTGASIAALTVYDMCKALSHDIVIGELRLVEKSGGKSDYHAVAPLAGLILAGGRSKRMAKDKAALSYAGETQLERAHRLLESVVPQVFVSVRRDQTGDPTRRPYRLIVDETDDAGPAAGIVAALRAHPGHAFLVVAVDLPFLSAQTLATLIAARDPARTATAYLSAHDGLPEPLCAIWEPAAGEELAASIARGALCPRKFLRQTAAKLVPLASASDLDNINTPDEYADALRRLGDGARP